MSWIPQRLHLSASSLRHTKMVKEANCFTADSWLAFLFCACVESKSLDRQVEVMIIHHWMWKPKNKTCKNTNCCIFAYTMLYIFAFCIVFRAVFSVNPYILAQFGLKMTCYAFQQQSELSNVRASLNASSVCWTLFALKPLNITASRLLQAAFPTDIDWEMWLHTVF